jgi:membrane fusion protein (multidrug efflux system)
VAEVLFEEGDAVSAGTPLLRLERERAAARVDEARARVTETRRNLTRLRELRDGKFVSATDLDRADAAAQAAAAALALAEEDLADRVVEAPFAGLVGRRLVSPGALLEPGTPVASLRRNDPLDLLLDVPEAAIGRVANGQRVTATTPAFPGKTFSGDVTFVGTRVDPATRTLALEATFPNPDGLLKPGMFLQAEVVTGNRELLTVPEAAVIARGPTEHLFVLRPATGPEEAGAPRARSGGQAPTVQRREVETGLRRAGWIAIDAGVTAGERVVVAGLQGLRDGATVRTGPPPGTAAGDGGPPEAGTAPADTDSGQGAAARQGQPAQ